MEIKRVSRELEVLRRDTGLKDVSSDEVRCKKLKKSKYGRK